MVLKEFIDLKIRQICKEFQLTPLQLIDVLKDVNWLNDNLKDYCSDLFQSSCSALSLMMKQQDLISQRDVIEFSPSKITTVTRPSDYTLQCCIPIMLAFVAINFKDKLAEINTLTPEVASDGFKEGNLNESVSTKQTES